MYGFYKSWIYRLWAFGGLLVVVGVVLYVGLTTQPGDPPPYAAIGAAVGIYLVGLLGLQAVGLFLSRPDDADGERPSIPMDPTHPPPTAEDLAEALALPDSDGTRSDRRSRARGDSYRFAWAQWLPMAAVALLLPLAGYLWVTGVVPQVWQPFGPAGMGIPVAALPGLAIVLVLVFLLPRTMGRAKQISDDYHAPLGLAITQTPQSVLLPRVGTDGLNHTLIGPTTFSGRRHGRRVVVDAYAGSSAVLVAQPGRDYSLDGSRNRLHVGGGQVPPGVLAFVKELADDSRFNAVSVSSGPDGVRVDRRGASVDQGWLLDLWLAERLADCSDASAAGSTGASSDQRSAPALNHRSGGAHPQHETPGSVMFPPPDLDPDAPPPA